METRIEQFKEIFDNINLMLYLQGMEKRYDDIPMYSSTFNQMFWRDIVIIFKIDTFTILIENKNSDLFNSIYNEISKNREYINSYSISNDINTCLSLKNILYKDMNEVAKMITKCI